MVKIERSTWVRAVGLESRSYPKIFRWEFVSVLHSDHRITSAIQISPIEERSKWAVDQVVLWIKQAGTMHELVRDSVRGATGNPTRFRVLPDACFLSRIGLSLRHEPWRLKDPNRALVFDAAQHRHRQDIGSKDKNPWFHRSGYGCQR